MFLKWVIPEKIHTPTDGVLDILAGGGLRASEIGADPREGI